MKNKLELYHFFKVLRKSHKFNYIDHFIYLILEICTCQDLYEILKKFICLSFDEIKFDFVIQVFYNEVNNVLFNGYVSYFINFIVKLKIYVFLEEFEFLQKINNDLSVLLKQIE